MVDRTVEELRARAEEVSALLKVLSHPNRLLIACDLMEGEHSVGEIESRTGVRQPALSRELARLREEGLVGTRRASKQIFYRLIDPRVPRLLDALCRSLRDERGARARAAELTDGGGPDEWSNIA